MSGAAGEPEPFILALPGWLIGFVPENDGTATAGQLAVYYNPERTRQWASLPAGHLAQDKRRRPRRCDTLRPLLPGCVGAGTDERDGAGGGVKYNHVSWERESLSLFVCRPFYCGLVGRGLDPSAGVGDAGPYSVATRKLSCCRKRPRRPEGWPPYKLPATAFVGEEFIHPGKHTSALHLRAGHARPLQPCHFLLVILFTKTLFDRLSNFPV